MACHEKWARNGLHTTFMACHDKIFFMAPPGKDMDSQGCIVDQNVIVMLTVIMIAVVTLTQAIVVITTGIVITRLVKIQN